MDSVPSTPRPHNEFHEASDKRKFFAKQRLPKELPIKPVKHDMPMMVVPTRHEARRMASKTPRRDFLTLPPVKPVPVQLPYVAQTARLFHGSVTPRNAKVASEAGGSTSHPSGSLTSRAAASVQLPRLTFSTTAALDGELTGHGLTKAAVAERFRSRLQDYVDHDDEDPVTRYHAAERNRKEIDLFEGRHSMGGDGSSEPGPLTSMLSEHHTVTTIDEEASTRVLKVMFQLNLTRNSSIISRLKELDAEYLHRKIAHELGYKKQMSRDEFFVLLCKVLKDDYINKRDCMTLFSVFDDDKSGLVDAVEFVSGFMTLIQAGDHDIAFKFIHTVLDSRGEKTIVNAFISRFELQLLVAAAQHHFASDGDIVRLLETVPSAFNFSHHLGRIPIVQLRDKIVNDEDLNAIFSALPNPTKPAREAAAAAVADATKGTKSSANSEQDETKEHEIHHSAAAHQHILADQYMSQNQDLQQKAEEHDSPRWWVSGGIVYKASEQNPYPQPVFLKENEKRR